MCVHNTVQKGKRGKCHSIIHLSEINVIPYIHIQNVKYCDMQFLIFRFYKIIKTLHYSIYELK